MGDDDGGRCGEQCHKERCSDHPVVIIPLCASQDYPCVVIDYPPEINLKCFFFFLQQGKQGLVRSNIVFTVGIKREITIYMLLIALFKGSSQY